MKVSKINTFSQQSRNLDLLTSDISTKANNFQNMSVITKNSAATSQGQNCPFSDLNTGFESSRRDLSSSNIRIALVAQKRHFSKFACALGFAGPVVYQTFST